MRGTDVVVVGAGIGAMHYTGMLAMRMAPQLKFDLAWFITSIVVAVALVVVLLGFVVAKLLDTLLSKLLAKFGLDRLMAGTGLTKLLAALGDFRQHAVQLLGVTAGRVVEFDQFAAFGQGEADTLATQNQFQADFVPWRIDPLLPATLGTEQALLFIEANGTGGDVELAGEVGNAVGLAAHGRAREWGHGAKLMSG